MKRRQQEKKNCHSEIRKKCTRIAHYSAQMDNGPPIDGPLYTVFNFRIKYSVRPQTCLTNTLCK